MINTIANTTVLMQHASPMYIRKTKVKSGSTGEPYFTYRLVESVRIGQTVKQRTVLNLGKHFSALLIVPATLAKN